MHFMFYLKVHLLVNKHKLLLLQLIKVAFKQIFAQNLELLVGLAYKVHLVHQDHKDHKLELPELPGEQELRELPELGLAL